MTPKRMQRKQVASVTAALLKRQGNKCAICQGALGARSVKTPALDHCHETGYIRGVLCINCNGVEGKIRNLIRRLGKNISKFDGIKAVHDYWLAHKEPQYGGVLHWTHLTEEEKRLKRNATAKKRRAAAKKATVS